MEATAPTQSSDWASPHGTEVSFEFRSHVGPRFVHGAVSLMFREAKEFSFVSQAEWPVGENHDNTVKAAIQEALASHGERSLKTQVVLKSIAWDPVNSSESGFRRAARAAAQAALSV